VIHTDLTSAGPCSVGPSLGERSEGARRYTNPALHD